MATFPEAENRLYKDVYVCRRCESKFKVPINKVLAGKAVCRNCDSKQVRIVRKKSKK
ncbi:MAG: hypothetical protein ACOCXG_02525 [Nanoarchaeota archaeon]